MLRAASCRRRMAVPAAGRGALRLPIPSSSGWGPGCSPPNDCMAKRHASTHAGTFGSPLGSLKTIYGRGRGDFADVLERPTLIRMGTPTSPSMHTVRHGAQTVDGKVNVDVFEGADGTLMVSGEAVVDRTSELAGVSTHARVESFMVVAALASPNTVALWSLNPSAEVPSGLIVRQDSDRVDHFLWAPARSMPLKDYQAELSRVGFGAGPSDWTMWRTPGELMDALNCPAATKHKFVTKAQAYIARKHGPARTPATVTGQAIIALCLACAADPASASLEFLSCAAELGASIYDGELPWKDVVGAASAIQSLQLPQVTVPAAVGGASSCANSRTPASLLGGQSVRAFSTSTRMRAVSLAFQIVAPGPLVMEPHMHEFIRAALAAKRDALLDEMLDMSDADSVRAFCDDYGSAWESAAAAFGVEF